ncbi:MAG: methionine synthase, partial [Planctomycetes bacterium]|nr:methionine synthase [Planctomycetota bacterium]
DGAMGTSLHALDLPLSDYRDRENCHEILNETRPDVVEQVHRSFLDAGCDAVETNTFGANRIVLSEFELADRAYELNVQAARIARRACAAIATTARPRFAAGAIGPGTRLISLRQVTYDSLLDACFEQIRGLLDGGVDVLLIETCQDILQTKTAIEAARRAFDVCGRQVPLMCQVTMETTGTMLMGTDIAAALATLEAYPEVHVIGLNCATGPREMSEHVRYLSKNCTRYISVMPNAGLPQVNNGQAHFPLTPDKLARWLREFVEIDGVNIVGGCCGTTPEHIKTLVAAVRDLKPVKRNVEPEPAITSLYSATAMRQQTSILLIGERCNTNGSRKFKRLVAEGDLDALEEMAKEQIREGAHVLDVCVDAVGRDGVADMAMVVDRFASDLTVPLVLDSTEVEVIEAGLKLVGGKCIVNSVSLEDGERRVGRVCRLLRQFGAAVVALTIDEDPDEAMAKTAQRKLGIATRIHELLTGKYGIAEENIFFDCLTFPITTGNEPDRRLALETLDGIEAIMKRFPRCQSVLGVSNVSFGLQPAARVVLNSAYMYEACQRGLTAAIVHAGKIFPRNQISDERWQAALDLIYDRRDADPTDGDPLERFISLFEDGEKIGDETKLADLPIEQRLTQRIINGNKRGLEADLNEALQTHPPLEIVNTLLLDGMKTVGELFGSGQMQLPFVLKSAETMKAAVAHLEPHMERFSDAVRGRIVLATVRGDVHDIGKNLVDIILSNNGYTVYNLGIRQPIGNVINALREHHADAIGLSGLLVKSTLAMRDDLEVLNEQNITVPVILGGAALTRDYVEQELRRVYKGEVHYAGDAFDGLNLMGEIAKRRAPAKMVTTVARISEDEAIPVAVDVASLERYQQETEQRFGLRPPDEEKEEHAAVAPAPAFEMVPPSAPVPRSDIGHEYPVPCPPFWGTRVLEEIDLDAPLAYVNELMLFQVQWGYRRKGRSAKEWQAYLDAEVRPKFRELVERCRREDILQPKAIYGYWPANSKGDDLIIFEPPSGTIKRPEHHGREVARFTFPRQHKAPYWCLADFWRPLSAGVPDVAALSVVTVGSKVSDVARQWFDENKYLQYLMLHGLGAESAEAL